METAEIPASKSCLSLQRPLAQSPLAPFQKVEPFQRALAECNKDILITGRRMDQAAQRISLDMWEEGKATLNPMAEFSWSDITAYVDEYDVPVNEGHNYAYRCKEPIEATSRHLPDLPWEVVSLGKPFWRCTEKEIKGDPPAGITYVFKSFGDTHTTVPVEPHESERTGRFVRLAYYMIHTYYIYIYIYIYMYTHYTLYTMYYIRYTIYDILYTVLYTMYYVVHTI